MTQTPDTPDTPTPEPAPRPPRAAANLWRELDIKLRPFIARRVPERDVDDVLQEVFLRIQRGLGALHDEERLGPWVHTLTRRAIADHLRTAARHPLSGGEPPPDDADATPAPNDTAPDDDAARELAGYLVPFVAALPSPYREALTLVELQGLSQREAADLLGLSHSGMKSRVQRGRALLRRTFEDCCHIALDARGHVTDFEPRPDGRLPDGCCR